jgi:DNA-binding IclR family transcriptional regulator
MSTVSTVADVLRCLEQTRELSVSYVAEALGQPKSSVSRLLKEMSRAGFLARNEQTRRYAPGPLLLSAGRHYKPSFSLIDRAENELAMLVERFGHTGFVMGLDRNNLILLRTVPGTHPVRVQIPERYEGGLAFYRSAGRALLARLSDTEVSALYPSATRPPSPKSPQDLPALLAALTEVRRRGFAESSSEAVPEVGGIAVAVGGPDEDAVALNIAFPVKLVSDAERQELASALVSVAATWGNAASST